MAVKLIMLSCSLQLPCQSARSQSLTSYPNQITPSVFSQFNPGTTITFGSSSSSCPVTTLNVSGYAADGDNWALFNNNNSTGRTGAGNYGVIAGVSMPFPSGLTKRCQDNLDAFIRATRLTANANLISTCATLKGANVDFHNPGLLKAFPDMAICKFVKSIAKKSSNTQGSGQEAGKINEEGFNLQILPRGGFTFGPPQAPLIQTLPLQSP